MAPSSVAPRLACRRARSTRRFRPSSSQETRSTAVRVRVRVYRTLRLYRDCLWSCRPFDRKFVVVGRSRCTRPDRSVQGCVHTPWAWSSVAGTAASLRMQSTAMARVGTVRTPGAFRRSTPLDHQSSPIYQFKNIHSKSSFRDTARRGRHSRPRRKNPAYWRLQSPKPALSSNEMRLDRPRLSRGVPVEPTFEFGF